MVKKLSEVPEGIKILAFLFFAGALISFAFGGFMFSFADGLNTMDTDLMASANLDQVNSWIVILIGMLLIGIAVFEYFLGRGLLKGRGWTRIVIGILAVLGIISAIMNFGNAMYASGFFGITTNGVVVWYLFVSDESKKFFK